MTGTAWARRLLRLLLGRREADAVVRDLEELSGGRSRLGSTMYFWRGVAGYPLRLLLHTLRERGARLRRTGGDGTMDGMWKDVRYAARSLRRSAGFTALAISILALSMGAATAIFSIVDGVLLDPLPLDRPDRLRAVWIHDSDGGRSRMTPGNLTDLRGLDGVFQHVAGFQGATAALSVGTGSVFVRGGAVTPDYFEALGVPLSLGRAFRADEARPGAAPVVILGHGLWQRAFGGDPDLLGRTVELSGALHEVVGVAPRGVYPTTVTVSAELPFTEANQDYFTPLVFSDEVWDLRRPHIIGAVARLRDGVAPQQADAALSTLSARLRATHPDNRDDALVARPFVEEVVGDVRFALLTLLGTVGLVLVIAAVNVGALFLLRGDDRASEIDIRLALGASSSRLTRQLLIESLLVSVPASLGALAVARLALVVMRGLVPYQIPRLADVQVDVMGLLTTLAVGGVLALLFGLAPAWRMFRRGGARGDRVRVTASRSQRRLHGTIVGAQAALGVTVLVGALLLARSFAALRSVDPGFQSGDTWVIPVSGAGDAMPELVRAVRDLPGVAHAAMAYDHPLERNWGDSFLIEGRTLQSGEDAPYGSLRAVGDGYFGVTGIEAVEGSIPEAVDLQGGAALAVVNEALRDAYFPAGTAVGQVIQVPSAGRMFGDAASRFVIAAVVRNVRFLGPERPAEPAFYLPLSHFPVGGSNLLVRPDRPGTDIVAGVRGALDAVAPGAALQSARRLDDILSDLTARPRFNAMLLVSFAGMGLLLCGLGAYGLVGRSVVTRLREIGIRMALGAERRHLARSVVGEALRPIMAGGLVGIAVAFGLGRVVRSLLYGITPHDPVSFAASALFLGAVGLVAALVPAARALAVDPARTLREE